MTKHSSRWTETYSLGLYYVRKVNPYLFLEVGPYLFCFTKWMLNTLQSESLFSCSTKWMSICYPPTYLLCPVWRTLISYIREIDPYLLCSARLVLTTYDHEADPYLLSWYSEVFIRKAYAYFSGSAQQMLIFTSLETGAYLYAEAGAFLLYFVSQMFVCYAPRGRPYLLYTGRRALIPY